MIGVINKPVNKAYNKGFALELIIKLKMSPWNFCKNSPELLENQINLANHLKKENQSHQQLQQIFIQEGEDMNIQ